MVLLLSGGGIGALLTRTALTKSAAPATPTKPAVRAKNDLTFLNRRYAALPLDDWGIVSETRFKTASEASGVELVLDTGESIGFLKDNGGTNYSISTAPSNKKFSPKAETIRGEIQGLAASKSPEPQ